jgi:hypothetical protein
MTSQISEIKTTDIFVYNWEGLYREDLLALVGCEVVFALIWVLENTDFALFIKIFFGKHLMLCVVYFHHLKLLIYITAGNQ